jgi:hypothetical protein
MGEDELDHMVRTEKGQGRKEVTVRPGARTKKEKFPAPGQHSVYDIRQRRHHRAGTTSGMPLLMRFGCGVQLFTAIAAEGQGQSSKAVLGRSFVARQSRTEDPEAWQFASDFACADIGELLPCW